MTWISHNDIFLFYIIYIDRKKPGWVDRKIFEIYNFMFYHV